MSKQNTLLSKRALIVIPDWGLAWYTFCLEHAVELSNAGVEVSILDLSSLNPRIFKRHFWKFALKVVQKNRLSDIKQKISRAHNIKLISCVIPKRRTSGYAMTKARNEIFVSAMASKYAYLTGRRDTRLDEIDQQVVEIEGYFFDSIVNFILALQDQFQFDEVITVNGRFVVDGAVVQACIEAQIKYSLIESAGSTPGLFEVFEISPHDIPSVQGMHRDFWEQAGPERNSIAERGLQKKLLGMENHGSDFRKNFTKSFAEGHESRSSKLAVFFPSSDREFAIFPEFNWRDSFGGSQGDAFLSFCRIAKANGYRVVVRVHPVDSKSPQELQDQFAAIEDGIWQKLCVAGGAQIIESRSEVSSYDLINKADLCVTYASSISVECILSEKPTLILGESEISHCVPEICAFNEADLNAKFNEKIPIIRRERLYPYGYWLEFAGRKPKFFEFASDQEVYFCNQLVNEYRVWARPLLVLKALYEKVQIIWLKRKSTNHDSLLS